VLLTTQYLDEADHLAGHVVIVDHGRAVASGSPAELKQQIGASVVELHVRDNRDLTRVAELLEQIDHGGAQIDEATRRVSVRVDSGKEGLMAAMQAVHHHAIEIEDMGMRQPNLDEVFLALTGKPAEDEQTATAMAA